MVDMEYTITESALETLVDEGEVVLEVEEERPMLPDTVRLKVR